MFCCAVLENLIAATSVNVCMMVAIRQSTTFNTGKFPNPYLVSLCTRLSGRTGGVGPVREAMAKGSELPGHEGKRKGRHCAGTRRGAAQSEALRCTGYVIPTKGFAEIERRALTARGAAQGNARGVTRPMPCNTMRALKISRPDPLCLPLVISSTFFATHGRRDSRSLARFDCAD